MLQLLGQQPHRPGRTTLYGENSMTLIRFPFSEVHRIIIHSNHSIQTYINGKKQWLPKNHKNQKGRVFGKGSYIWERAGFQNGKWYGCILECLLRWRYIYIYIQNISDISYLWKKTVYPNRSWELWFWPTGGDWKWRMELDLLPIGSMGLVYLPMFGLRLW